MRTGPRAPARAARLLAVVVLLALAAACAPAAQPTLQEPAPEPAAAPANVELRELRSMQPVAATPPRPRRAALAFRHGSHPPRLDAGPVSATRIAAAPRELPRVVHAAVDGRTVRVNVGGPEVTAGGVVWLEDRHVDAAGAAFANQALESIANTEADAIYRTERNTGGDGEGALLRYVVPVPDGRYQVILHFAEIYFGTPGNPAAEPGQRRFDVLLGGELVLGDYDVFVAAGGAATAVTESFTVDAAEGTITLTIQNGSANRGKLSAFEILPVDAGG